MTTIRKLLPPAPNTAVYPTGANFGRLREWDEGAAAQDALNRNAVLAEEYLNEFRSTWLVNYMAHGPWDATPPAPSVQRWALITETNEDNGALSVTYELVDSPTGARVCEVPGYQRLSPPQAPGSGSIVTRTAEPGNPTIAVVDVANMSTASDGTKWVRVA